MSTTPPPMSPRSAEINLHTGVSRAVDLMWDNKPDEAEKILEKKKDTNPRYALEWAHTLLGLMSASNEQRESMLSRFQHADNLATANKYGEPMMEFDEDVDQAMMDAANEDMSQLSDKEKAKLQKAQEKQREKDKEEYKKRVKAAAKSGENAGNLWKLECDVIYADALLVRSIVQLTLNSYMRGGINLRKTWGCYYALMAEVEKDKDDEITPEVKNNIKYGCGVFYTYLALVPAGLMKLLSAIGFISDKELGEQYLTDVLNSDTIRTPFAALVLCTYYLFLPTGLGNVNTTLSKAKIVLDKMNEKYPNNSYFWGYLNFYHRKRGETQEAVAAIEKASANALAANAVPTLLRYLLADTLYMDLQFAEAKAKYTAVLDLLEESGETFAYTGQIVISLAACNVMLGDKAAAVTWLKRVNSMYNPKSKQDANSPKFATRVLNDLKLLPLIGVYVLYINRDLAHMQPAQVDKLNVALTEVTKDEDMTSFEVRGMYKLFQGVMHKGCKRPDEAREAWQEVMGFEKKLSSSSAVLPYLYYEMGELEYRQGDLPKAKQYFDKGAALKGDGHETLANRYSIASKQLKREMAEKEGK